MFEKLALVGRDLLLETLPKYLSGQLKAQAQNEDEVTFSPNISPEEEKSTGINLHVKFSIKFVV